MKLISDSYFFYEASGDGDTIMRFCPSFQIVELMDRGKSPQDACEYAVKRIIDKCGERTEVALIALDMLVGIGVRFGLHSTLFVTAFIGLTLMSK